MKKLKRLALLLGITLIAFFQSCKKDNKESDDFINPVVKEENIRLDSVVPTTTITTYLQGKILDEDGNPVSDVEVSTNGNTITTDDKGFFTFGELTIKDSYAVVVANKSGFFTGVRTFSPTADAFNTIVIQLMKKNTAQTFTASSGASLEFESGKVKLEFPANCIATKTGTAYSGTVKVYARYIDPTSDNFTGIIPGMLAGLTTDNQLTGMISYGMVNVELEDNGGNKLEIASNKKVKVSIPAKTSDPAIIPTWHFNEKYGLWVEAGTATKQGAIYTFDANCFSPWNCDMIINPVNVNIILKDQNGQTINNQRIDIYTSDYVNRISTVYTDGNGKCVLLRVPQNLGLKIITSCGSTINKPLSISSSTAIITVNNADITNGRIYTLKGKLKSCGDTLYANKYYTLTSIDGSEINFGGKTDANGNYLCSSILCSSVNSTAIYKFKALVYISNLDVKIDTINIIFTGNTQTKDVDFCGLNLVNIQFNPSLTYGTMTDIDGNVYKTIVIGTKTWMAENLKTTRYNDGTPIVTGLSDSAWQNSFYTGAYAIYDNNSDNNDVYGKLYNWYSVNSGKLAPVGWHIPNEDEWLNLSATLGGDSISGGKFKSISILWNSPNTAATNSTGLSVLPGGLRQYNGQYFNMNKYCNFWTTTHYASDEAMYILFSYDSNYFIPYHKNYMNGLSVRCVKN